jgi:hypothetical protein
MGSSRNESRILALIAQGPTTNRRIAEALNLGIDTTNSILGRLNERKDIECVGHADHFGFTDCLRTARVWGIKGTPRAGDLRQRAKKQLTANPANVAGPITIGRGMAGWPSNRSRAQ